MYMNRSPTPNPLSLGLLLTSPMDCEAFRSTLESGSNMEIAVASADFEFGIARCTRAAPNALIFDPSIHVEAIERVLALSCAGLIEFAIVLDQTLREWRVKAILEYSNFSYLTRQSSLEMLISSIEKIAETGQRVFDPSVENQLRIDTPGVNLKWNSNNKQSLTQLTARELEVLKLLASGKTVRRCAELLELAESTIDNHKSNLMKKLDLHKTAELVLLAIREGLLNA